MSINILTVFYLTAAAVLDILKREVSLRMTAVYAALVAADMAITTAESGNRLWSLACGGAAAVISILSGEALGMGDAVVIAALGLAYPLGSLLRILLGSSALCGIFCLILIVKKKGDVPKQGIPFIPFLLAGALCHMAL